MSWMRPRRADSLKLTYRESQKPLRKVMGNVTRKEAMCALMAIGPMRSML